MKYTFLFDVGELYSETQEFDSDEQALAYGQDLFDHSNAAYITVLNSDGKEIGDFE